MQSTFIRLEEEVEHNPFVTQDTVTNASATTGRAMFGAVLTTAGGFRAEFVSITSHFDCSVKHLWLQSPSPLSSLILLPAFYNSFLKRDAEKYSLLSNDISESPEAE